MTGTKTPTWRVQRPIRNWLCPVSIGLATAHLPVRWSNNRLTVKVPSYSRPQPRPRLRGLFLFTHQATLPAAWAHQQSSSTTALQGPLVGFSLWDLAGGPPWPLSPPDPLSFQRGSWLGFPWDHFTPLTCSPSLCSITPLTTGPPQTHTHPAAGTTTCKQSLIILGDGSHPMLAPLSPQHPPLPRATLSQGRGGSLQPAHADSCKK